MGVTLYSYVFRIARKITTSVLDSIYRVAAYSVLHGNGVRFDKTLVCKGIPVVDVDRTAICLIGKNCKINSNIRFNPIGRYSPTFLIVRKNAVLTIGNDSGISSSAIVCHKKIEIGERVKLGGNVTIYDTDFHSLDIAKRSDQQADREDTSSKAVRIEDDVFIGAHSTILKGVTIGRGAVIGACSVVTRDVPPFEIWAGSPAIFRKSIAK